MDTSGIMLVEQAGGQRECCASSGHFWREMHPALLVAKKAIAEKS
jgi:hypothetical protein